MKEIYVSLFAITKSNTNHSLCCWRLEGLIITGMFHAQFHMHFCNLGWMLSFFCDEISHHHVRIW